ncbi:MAG: GNAT family N-acetyltransferase [Bacillus sp. (in: firmicutes)]
MTIRKARKEDSVQAAVLIYDAIHDIADALTGETEKQKVLKQLEVYFQQEVNRVSYSNCLVKVVEGEVVGLVIAYHGKDASIIDAPILTHLESKFPDKQITIDQETEEEDFYLDTVSVNPHFAGRGYGTELLQAAIEYAKQSGYATVSLNVEENNMRARRLYERLGFEQTMERVINHHTYGYLVKHM